MAPAPGEPPAASPATPPETGSSPESARRDAGVSSAHLVAGGILLSRIAGLVREGVFSHFFGASAAADAFRTALRMPNVLQNLLGEGVLSASFIPVYSELLEAGREEEAGRVAGAVFALLFALAGGLALLGIAAAPLLVSVFTPGYVDDPRYDLTVSLVRIIFPMTGVLVLSAWSLGVLNSHRRFFIPYVAPVLWNAAMIGTMLLFGTDMSGSSLAVALAWGALLGGVLQFGVQLPWVLRLERSLRIRWDLKLEGVRTAVRNAGPAIAGRGVVNLSAYVDLFLASLLAIGAVAHLTYAQTLYVLPVSLFGMSVAAAELPELARQRLGEVEVLRARVSAGLLRIAFFVVPSAVGFLVLGDVLVAALYQRGDFEPADTLLVYLVLVGYTVGLLASTGTRLFSSAYFALHDTRTPAVYASVRVALAAVVGAALMVQVGQVSLFGRTWGPYGFGLLAVAPVAGRSLGPVGLSLAAGLAAWVEWVLLRRRLRYRIGDVSPPAGPLARMLLAALAGAAAGRGTLLALPELHPIPEAAVAVGAFGLVYFAVARAFGLAEAERVLGRLPGPLGGGRKRRREDG